MNYIDLYNSISNSASIFGLLFLIAVGIWILAIKKIERKEKKK